MFISPVVLLVTYDGETSVLVRSDGKDYHVTRLVIVIGCYDGAFTLEVPFIAIIYLFATKSELCGKFFLLTVLHLLHTVKGVFIICFTLAVEILCKKSSKNWYEQICNLKY